MARFIMNPPFTYPHAPKADVVDEYHGTPVADPYHWDDFYAAAS